MMALLFAIVLMFAAGASSGTPQAQPSPSATPASACAGIERQVAEAAKAGNLNRVRKVYEEAELHRTCVGADLIRLGRTVAYLHYAKAFDGTAALPDQEQLLRQGLNFGRPWEVVAAMADLEKAAKHYDKAAALFQEALDDLRNEKLNPKAPAAAVIASLFKKAEETRMLAPHYVARTLRGAPSGLACRTFRGFTVARTALPIHFEYDKAEFTPEGRKAVEDLFRFLVNQGAPAVHLVGHTDPRGSDDYNLALSRRRAEAVAAALKVRGYQGDVRISGRGKAEPFKADDPASYTEEERYQLDRRVELDRTEGTCPAPSG